MVRTHGITYDSVDDLMLLTDVGDAASATDGALVAIRNFTAASADGVIDMSEQGRAKGGASMLGNPVDIAYDRDNGRVFVAERANGGGRVLGFKMPILTGGIAPFYNELFAGASAIHLPGNNGGAASPQGNGGAATYSAQTAATTVSFDKLFPVPATSTLNVQLSSTLDQAVNIRVINVNGSLVMVEPITLVKGMNTVELNVNELGEGMYIINIPSIGIQKKFFKVN